jgi:hypothetical protein
MYKTHLFRIHYHISCICQSNCQLPEDGQKLWPKKVGAITNKNTVQQVDNIYYICNNMVAQKICRGMFNTFPAVEYTDQQFSNFFRHEWNHMFFTDSVVWSIKMTTCTDFALYCVHHATMWHVYHSCPSPSKARHYVHGSPASPNRNQILSGEQDTNFMSVQSTLRFKVKNMDQRWNAMKKWKVEGRTWGTLVPSGRRSITYSVWEHNAYISSVKNSRNIEYEQIR